MSLLKALMADASTDPNLWIGIAALFLFFLGWCEHLSLKWARPRCSRCRKKIDNPWPGEGGDICQMCWERYCSEQWWEMFKERG